MGKAKSLAGSFIGLSKEGRDETAHETTKAQKGEITLRGEVLLPIELSNQIHQLLINQKRIEARIDLLFGVLQKMGINESNGSVENYEDESISRIQWGKTEEEQKLTLFQIFKEAEHRGSALRTTELKELGGKFSTAVSYSYKIFGGFKEALRSYKDFRSIDGDKIN